MRDYSALEANAQDPQTPICPGAQFLPAQLPAVGKAGKAKAPRGVEAGRHQGPEALAHQGVDRIGGREAVQVEAGPDRGQGQALAGLIAREAPVGKDRDEGIAVVPLPVPPGFKDTLQ